ncbi:hypothetical protein [Bradyrhizobium canariense]|uniref:hypothetical protein n=1 Tax=Bradyrhizobium canariense TaxID=255045 RepID=UPI001FCDDDA4|nr:hypothetical protein [Bradyrhizobium canariense]
MTMVRVQKSRAGANAWRADAGRESSIGDIQARIVELRSLPREKLADAAFMLSMNARSQRELIREAIEKRAAVELDFDPPAKGDLATYLADDVVSTLRDHVSELPTLMDLLVQRAPDVRFTVHREEAVSLLAAIVREQRLEGVLEGLRLAGLLNEPAKHRHGGFCSEVDLREATDGREWRGRFEDNPCRWNVYRQQGRRISRRLLARSKPLEIRGAVPCRPFIADAELPCTLHGSPERV